MNKEIRSRILARVRVDATCVATFQDPNKNQEILKLRNLEICQFHSSAPLAAFIWIEMKAVELVIKCLKQNPEDLVKISLIYSGKALQQFTSCQEVIDGGFGYLVRSYSNYYFPPDQLDAVTKEIKKRYPNVATNTRPYSYLTQQQAQEVYDLLCDSPA